MLKLYRFKLFMASFFYKGFTDSFLNPNKASFFRINTVYLHAIKL